MRRELISLDMPHFVSSDDSFDINQVTLDAYASDIEQARTALKLGTVVVMGHSIHGDLALEYASSLSAARLARGRHRFVPCGRARTWQIITGFLG